MAYGYVGQFSAQAGAAAASVAAAGVTFAAGENVIVVLSWHVSGGPVITLNSVTDGVNTYSRIGTTFVDVNADGWGMFYAQNVAAGTGMTVTGTLSGTSANPPWITGYRYTGLDYTLKPSAMYGNLQATPTTGTDAVTTGLMTPDTAAATMVWALGIDAQHGTGHLTAGTGFTPRGRAGTFLDMIFEDLAYASTTPIAGTFTTDINDARSTVGAVFQQTGTAPTPGPLPKQIYRMP